MIKVKSSQCNNFLIEQGTSVVLIDTGFAKEKEFEKFLAGVTIRLIILTHEHTDHLTALKKIKTKYKVPVIAHKAAADIVRRGEITIPAGITRAGRFLHRSLGNAVKNLKLDPVEIDIVFDKEYDLKEFGIDGTLFHTPGHSPGSLSVFFEDAVFIGDMLFNVPLLNMRYKTPLFADDMELLAKSLQCIVDKEPVEFFPGHGNKFYLKDARKTLLYIQKQIKAGAFPRKSP